MVMGGAVAAIPRSDRARATVITMNKFTVTVMMVLGTLVGCGAKKDANDTSMDQMTAFIDQMCACKDQACAGKVMDEVTKWSQTDKRPLSERQLTDDQQKRFDADSKRYMDCTMKTNEMK